MRQAEVSTRLWEEERTGKGIEKWHNCFECGRGFHTLVHLALGWACWASFLGRPESDIMRIQAMGVLGNALTEGKGSIEDAVTVLEAASDTRGRFYPQDIENIFFDQSNLANAYGRMGSEDGRPDAPQWRAKSLAIHRHMYDMANVALGATNTTTIESGQNLLISMFENELFHEARILGRSLVSNSRALGEDDPVKLQGLWAIAVIEEKDPNSSREDVDRAGAQLYDIMLRHRRVLGAAHPDTQRCENDLVRMQEKFKSFG